MLLSHGAASCKKKSKNGRLEGYSPEEEGQHSMVA